MGKIADPIGLLALAALGTQQVPSKASLVAQAPNLPFIIPAGPQRAPGKR